MSKELTELEKNFSPSYFVKNNDAPDKVVGKWIEFHNKCFDETAKKYRVDFDRKHMICGIQNMLEKTLKALETLEAQVGISSTCSLNKGLADTPEHIHIFVHGGYWQECSRKTYGAVMNGFLASGIAVVMLGYSLASPDVPLDNLLVQVEEAIRSISGRFPKSAMSLSGHSAGAHLIAKAIEKPEIGRLVRSATLISCIYDLVPLVDTYIGRGINLTVETAKRMSVDPNKIATNFNGKLFCVCSNFDAPALIGQFEEFVEQARDRKRFSVERFDEDHFSIISCLNDPKSNVTRSVIEFILSS